MAQNRQQYTDLFEEALLSLNANQRRAVDQLEGPVLVVAGPGTGKTQLLAARIGRILQLTDTQPANILCLTFSDAGAMAMRQRLLSLIGPEAHRLPVYTFHAFCNRVVQENLQLFNRTELQPLSELERVDIMRELLDGCKPGSPLRAGIHSNYFYEKHLAALFALMKSENWTPDYMSAQIDRYLESLPGRPEFVYQVNSGPHKKGDLKPARIDSARKAMELLRSAAALLPAYQEKLRLANRYDYNDMISWVIRAFQSYEWLLRNYQEQFLYILCDEFQDTNGAQYEILKLLTGYWDNPNIFLVGDDDQSVYEFQGARLRNLTDFYTRYEAVLTTVVLTDNYRSGQPLLDAAGRLIQLNTRRIGQQLAQLGMEKMLTACRAGSDDFVLQLRVYPTRLQELSAVADALAARRVAGVDWHRMAVIYAVHRQADDLQRLLRQRGIPYRSRRPVNVLEAVAVRQLRELLMYVALEAAQPGSGEGSLFRLLHFRCLRLLPADLAALALHRAAADEALPPWRQWLQAGQWPAGVQQPAALTAVAAWLEEMIGQVYDLPLPRLVEQAINRSGLLRQAAEGPEAHTALLLLKTVADLAGEASARRPDLGLREWLDSLTRMEENGILLPAEQDDYQTGGVQLLTAHSAKGLEFDTVCLLDATAAFWDPGSRARGLQFSLPDTITFSAEEDALEARRRLFYVAMTRAENALFISYATHADDGKPLERSQFVEELIAEAGLEPVAVSLPVAERQEVLLGLLQPAAPGMLLPLPREAVSALLAGFRLSPAALERYLNCPLAFFYETVLKAPRLPSSPAAYGSALHEALQWLFNQMMAHPGKIFPTATELSARFARALQRQRGSIPLQKFDELLTEGASLLQAYYQQQLEQWPRQVRTEWQLRNVELRGVPLTGIIDRFDWLEGQGGRVVDYKSGKRQERKLARPTARNPQGGSYWRQLTFYKLLADQWLQFSGRSVSSGAIAYLQPNWKGVFEEDVIELSSEDTHALEDILVTTYRRITEEQAFPGCGQPHCAWCNFVALGQEVEAFYSEATEDVDDAS